MVAQYNMSSLDLFESHHPIKVCAPMVRYSSLPFRKLVRKYGCDLTFTPMIVAESFVQSSSARENDFIFDLDDKPLIVQFAAKCSQVLSQASKIVSNYCDGVDLNCGCPQRWAVQEGYGSCLLKHPELISDMVLCTKRNICKDNFSISIKVRINNDMRKTVELCRRAEAAGCSWISVHGRTPEQRCQPADWSAIKIITDSLKIPVIANGDIKNLQDVHLVCEQTGARGAMTARGLLSNPAMFAGYEFTPKQCIVDWVQLASEYGTPFQLFHNHLIYMLEYILPKSDRRLFNSLVSSSAVLQFLENHYDFNFNESINDNDTTPLF